MNYADSEKITMILTSAGIRKVIDPTKADIVLMNTCSVRQKWEDKVFGFMNEVSRYHKKNQTKPPVFGITGCMVRKTGIAKRYLRDESWDLYDGYKRKGATDITFLDDAKSLLNYDDSLFLRSPLIDFVFRIEEVSFLTKILSTLSGENIGNDAKFNEYLQVKQLQENPASANIIIQTGCDNFCTYCIVPHTRGRELSRPQSEIVIEAREVVRNGTKEITLLGQNVNSYGKETHAKLWNPLELTWVNKDITTPFRALLNELNSIDWLERIRFTSSNPHDMTRDILDAHFELPKMCNYLHFALQSWSDTVLRRMNRKHTYHDFRTQVEYLRSRDCTFAISTDIIVGFPGETEEEFQETIRAMEEIQFDFAYIARYSPRSGTIADQQYEDDISSDEKTRRWTILNDILGESIKNRAEMLLGREEDILISWKGKFDGWVGRTKNFREVYIPLESSVSTGDIIRTKITQLDGWVLCWESV